MPLPLRLGTTGEEVRDLHRRLAAAGFGIGSTADLLTYSPATEESVASFQCSRGLEPTGTCDQSCWSALVEAGFHLGDRLLYHTRPMLRGDDVAELQARLGSLGFDAGRTDGIFGPQTEHAVADFQRNAGLTSDGVAGLHTIAELVRLSARATTSRPVAQVRETELLMALPPELAGLRVAIGDDGSAHALVHALGRQLRVHGAAVIEEHGTDWSAFARVANDFGATAALSICISDGDMRSLSFFQTDSSTSPGGRRLAQLIDDRPRVVQPDATGAITGSRHPVLRETRMPAVLCSMGPPALVAQRSTALAQGLVDALAAWLRDPLPSTTT